MAQTRITVTSRIVLRDKDGFPIDVILYPPPGYLEMFVPDPIWSTDATTDPA